MKKVLFALSIMVMVGLQAIAQTTNVTGTVTDAGDGLPIPGVSVFVKGTTIGTVTTPDGAYSLAIPDGSSAIVFSFVGMKTQEVAYTGQTVINASMQSDAVDVGEVVVTALGIKREKKALGYAVQEVGGEELSAAGFQDISKGLQGKVAGVNVRQSSGMPGASSTINIRGVTSLSGSNEPLYVIDGVPVSSGRDFGELVGSGTNPSARSLDINPDDIESMNVLKGPAAAALYGLRASNGVIVITTKSGSGMKEGQVRVDVSSNYTYDAVGRLPDVQKEYSQGSRGAFNGGTSLSWGAKISEMGTYTNALGEQEVAAAYDNMDDFFRSGHTFTNSINVSKGTKEGNYSIGIASTNQTGIVETTGMERYNAKFNGSFNLTEKFKLGTSFNYASTSVDKIPGGSNLSNPLFTTYFAPSSYNLAGKPFEDPNDPNKQIHYRAAMDNPYWSLEHNSAEEKTNRFFGNINLAYDFTDWFTLQYRVGLDNYTTTQDDFLDLGAGATGGRTQTPSGGQITTRIFTNNQFNSNLSAVFNKEINENLKGTLVAGNEIYDVRTDANTMIGRGLSLGGFDHISNTSTLETSRTQTWQRVVGFYGNLNVDYKSMLFFNATGRYDVVSNMPAKNRGFFYPSASVGFVFTELNAFEGLENVLSFGKLRTSLAQVGQAGNLYSTKTLYNKGGHSNGFISSFTFPFNGQNAYTLSNTLLSDELTPENTTTFEVGLDLKFFNNRFGIDYTYYASNSDDQIFSVPIARSSGFTERYTNAGGLKTWGHEVIMYITPVKTSSFQWDFNTNFSLNRAEVTDLAEGVEQIQSGYQNFASTGAYGRVGYLYPVIVGSTYKRDDNGNMLIDDNASSSTYGMPMQGDVDVIAEVTPDFDINFTNTFRYKGLSLSFQIDWRQGGHMWSGTNRLGQLYGVFTETGNRDEGLVIEGVKESNGQKNDIAITDHQTYYSNVISDISEAHVYETTHVRLRELTIAYEIPKSVYSGTFIKSISVNLQGRNLWLWTKDLPNIDPETSTSSGNSIGAFEYVGLPNTTAFGGGFKLTF